jgi:hypothetical protein
MCFPYVKCYLLAFENAAFLFIVLITGTGSDNRCEQQQLNGSFFHVG